MKRTIIALLVLVVAAALGLGLMGFQESTPDTLEVDIAIATLEDELEDLDQEELDELEEELLLLGQ